MFGVKVTTGFHPQSLYPGAALAAVLTKYSAGRSAHFVSKASPTIKYVHEVKTIGYCAHGTVGQAYVGYASFDKLDVRALPALCWA